MSTAGVNASSGSTSGSSSNAGTTARSTGDTTGGSTGTLGDTTGGSTGTLGGTTGSTLGGTTAGSTGTSTDTSTSNDTSDDDQVFKALASPVRRRILDLLKAASRTTGELCEQFDHLDRTTVLQHLRVLERAELVTGRKIGRERHLSLAPVPIKRIHDRWISQYAHAAVDLLERLDR